MRGKLLIWLLALISFEVYCPLYGQSTSSDFDAMVESFNSSFDQMTAEGNDAIASIEAEYDALQSKIVLEYDAFCDEVESLWGDTTAVVGDSYRWVEYGEDNLSRSVVDFESGRVEVELLLTDEELANVALVEERLSAAVTQLATSKGSSVEYDSEYIAKEEVSPTPIMNEIFDIRAGNITREAAAARGTATVELSETELDNIALEQEVDGLRLQLAALTPRASAEEEAEEPAEDQAEDTPATQPSSASTVVAEVSKVQTAEGERNVVTVKTNLAVGYVGELAKRYESDIVAYSKRFNISPTLVFAVMETESYFNPTAKSHVPAYGLMQIVPKYAGRDAYKAIYGQDKILSESYLYKSSQNIEIGVAYLSILAKSYFKSVTDPDCRELCMIAAYNTGAGNVSKAMVGHTNIYKAIPSINAMSYDQLYAHLRKNLPYDETRKYIEKVTTKRKKYMAQ